ncbi:glycosyltransferase family 39 protein [Edaphobacter aggregans]|uniref:glycosyltransferase family 39 protein n=1 Tax=Edaphobacter aggregans TaxID=570835 RepID=UPI000557ADF6|nr:glycosyltransferase family 39 protein [Edaphobacter aggregans]
MIDTRSTHVHYGKAVVSSALERLERISAAIERLPIRVPILFFLALYFSIAIAKAKSRLMWDDEFFTLYISRIGTMKGILEALATGADQHPPPFYYLTHLLTVLFGTSHLTVRLLPMLGYGLMCVCLFLILYRRTSLLWAFLGMILPIASSAFYYATEARGYGVELGFCALALLAWQRVTSSSSKRAWWLLTLFMACGMAVSSHYYAVLFVFALALGELARTIQLKRFDFLVWLSFFGAAIPLLVFLGTIRKASEYSAHFWAVPIWGALLEYYVQMLGELANILVVGAVPYLIMLLRSESQEENYRAEICRFSTYEVIAWSAIAAVPVFAMILAKTVTHGYVERYAISAIVGAIVLLCHFGYAVAPRPRSFALVLCVAGLLYIVPYSVRLVLINRLAVVKLGGNLSMIDARSTSPLVLGDYTLFHQASFYAPRKQIQNLLYVADPLASVEYISKDTVDRSAIGMRPWFPLNIMTRKGFVATHSDFLVYSYVGSWTWITYVLLPPYYETSLLDRHEGEILLKAHRVGNAPADESDDSPLQPASESLFDKMSKDGPSLCKQWMPHDGFCDEVEKRRQQADADR